jgi:nucleoside-diphosphate-sugar epimerase
MFTGGYKKMKIENHPLKKIAGKQVLITGGLGFIGSNLARRLVGLGARVTLVDSLIPEYGGNLFNVDDIKNQVTINISDVRDEHSMKYLVQNNDYLFNLAGQTSHMDSMENPRNDLEINAEAQLSILEACRNFNPDIKVVFASTRQIYGKPDYLPVDEKHPLRPVDINGVNKLAGEWYHLLYHQVYGIRTSVLRLTNTIGPAMRIKDTRQTFVGIWIRLLVEGKPFEVWGGEQLRDFTYVDDAVEAFLLAALDDKAVGKVFNLGGNDIINLKQLADLLIEINGKGKYRVRHYPNERKKIDIGDFYASFVLIENTLGWKPQYSLKDSLSKTLEYYTKNYARYL